MRISDWSSDVCSSDLVSLLDVTVATLANQAFNFFATGENPPRYGNAHPNIVPYQSFPTADRGINLAIGNDSQFRRLCDAIGRSDLRSEEHTSELQSLMRISYAVFCLKKKK